MWLLQACFVCRQAYFGLSLKYHLPMTQERLERDYLGHYCEKSLKLCDWSSNQATLFDRKTWNSECQGMYRAKLTSYLDTYTDTEPGTISNTFESLKKFQGRSTF